MSLFNFKKKKTSQSKFSNEVIECSGMSFHSKLEAAVFQLLKLREKVGEIEVLQQQDHVYLTDARIHYIPDFKCKDLKTGEYFWVEAKGFANDRWPTKKKLWKFYGPGELHIYKGTYKKPFLDEVVNPKERKK